MSNSIVMIETNDYPTTMQIINIVSNNDEIEIIKKLKSEDGSLSLILSGKPEKLEPVYNHINLEFKLSGKIKAVHFIQKPDEKLKDIFGLNF